MSLFDIFNNILHDDGAPEHTSEDSMSFDIFHIVIEDEDEEDDYY